MAAGAICVMCITPYLQNTQYMQEQCTDTASVCLLSDAQLSATTRLILITC